MLFVVKTSCQDWGQVYLLQERGLSAYSASAYLTSMEVGGIAGSIVMGALTDFMIRRRYYFGTGKSPRMIVVQLCVAGSCLFLNLFLFSIDPESSHVSTSSTLALQFTNNSLLEYGVISRPWPLTVQLNICGKILTCSICFRATSQA